MGDYKFYLEYFNESQTLFIPNNTLCGTYHFGLALS